MVLYELSHLVQNGEFVIGPLCDIFVVVMSRYDMRKEEKVRYRAFISAAHNQSSFNQ